MITWTKRLLLTLTFLALIATNILTLAHSAFNAALSGLMSTEAGRPDWCHTLCRSTVSTLTYYTVQSSRTPLKNLLAWAPACCSSGMNEQDLQGHRCEHVFREIGGMFAKFSGSATILQREIYSQQPVYLPLYFN
jgi:hypothetical protein